MKWVYMEHEIDGERGIKPSFCHPLYYKTRMAHVLEKYRARTVKIAHHDNCWVDLGGMIQCGDPSIDIELSPDRLFGCWKHQASAVIYILEKSKPVEHGRICFRRFARWPGVICFISQKDLLRVLRVLRRVVDVGEEVAHRAAMREGLVAANVRGRGPEVEAKVRELMGCNQPLN